MIVSKAYSMTKPIRLEDLADCAAWRGGATRKGREEGPQAWKVSAADIKARGYNVDIKNPHTVAADHGDPETLLADLDATEAQVAAVIIGRMSSVYWVANSVAAIAVPSGLAISRAFPATQASAPSGSTRSQPR